MAVSFTAAASSYQVPSQSAYSSRKWRAAIVVSQSSTAIKTTITVTLYFDGAKANWGEVGKYVSGNIKIGGTTVKSFSAGDQSWSYTNLTEKKVLTATKTFDRTNTAQNITVSGTVKVNSPSAYRNGNSSTVSYTNTNSIVPALNTFKITYNGNGGTPKTGSNTEIPKTVTYYYNQSTFNTYGLPDYDSATGTWNLEKTNYKSTGNWQTTSTGGTLISETKTYTTTQALYQAITGNAWAGTSSISTAITLYAGWKLDYIAPTFTIVANRVDDSGEPTPNGTKIKIQINYTNGILGGVVQELKLTISINGTLIVNQENLGTIAQGTYSKIENGPYSIDSSFTISVQLQNVNQTAVTKTYVVPAVKYPIDLQVSGDNVYMGLMHLANVNNNESTRPITTAGMIIDGTLKINSMSTNTIQSNVLFDNNNKLLTYNPNSSKRYKHDIEVLNKSTLDPTLLYDIPLRQFKYNEAYLAETDIRNNVDVPGFIAEEMYEIYPIAVDLDNEGKPNNWNTRYLIPPMLALIQKQHKEIEQLKQDIELLKQNKL